MSDKRNDKRNLNWGTPEKRKKQKEREENNSIERGKIKGKDKREGKTEAESRPG